LLNGFGILSGIQVIRILNVIFWFSFNGYVLRRDGGMGKKGIREGGRRWEGGTRGGRRGSVGEGEWLRREGGRGGGRIGKSGVGWVVGCREVDAMKMGSVNGSRQGGCRKKIEEGGEAWLWNKTRIRLTVKTFFNGMD